MMITTVLILFLLILVNVCGNDGVEIENDKLPVVFGYPNRERRAHVDLPLFSKKEKGKGGSMNMSEEYYQGEWVWETKSDKKYKGSKKEKKDGKKEKKEKYVWEQPAKTRNPTSKPVSYSPPPSLLPTRRNDNKSGSTSEDMPTTTGISDDCPPSRPPTVIPPSPSSVPINQSVTIPAPTTQLDEKNAKRVRIEIYAINYTLFQTDRDVLKNDYVELEILTSSYFKNLMVNAYKVSTEANLIDFRTSFVNASFTPGEPVHIIYNSTAYFDEASINLPASEIVFAVLSKSLENPKSYIDELKLRLNEANPFSSATNIILTDPKVTTVTRSITTRAKSVFGIAGAGVFMALTLTILTGITRCRNANSNDENDDTVYFRKQIRCDTTAAGETFISDTKDSGDDGTFSIFSSTGFEGKNEMRKFDSPLEEIKNKSNQLEITIQTSTNGDSSPPRRPRTVAEIENLLSLGDGGII